MHILKAIEELNRLVFTTNEIAALAGLSLSLANQMLTRIEGQGLIAKIKRGVWGKIYDKRFEANDVIPFLNTGHRSYLSFVSALHKHGIISQIPQEITVASTAHSKSMTTAAGTFVIHQISPSFFDGFVLSESKNYYIATPEKALVDCLYLSFKKGRRFSFFPEMDFSAGFGIKKAKGWIGKISDNRIRRLVFEKFEKIIV